MDLAAGLDLTVSNNPFNQMALTLGVWIVLMALAFALSEIFLPRLLRVIMRPVIALGGIYLLSVYLS